MLDELKILITAAIVKVTKDMVQRDWQDVNICRATDGAQCEVFRICV
jgi:hypothetical protein